MKEKVQSIDLDQEQINALLQRASQNKLEEEDLDIIKALIQVIQILHQAVDDKATSIKRLLHMIFGGSTEKKRTSFKTRTSRAKIKRILKTRGSPKPRKSHPRDTAEMEKTTIPGPQPAHTLTNP